MWAKMDETVSDTPRVGSDGLTPAPRSVEDVCATLEKLAQNAMESARGLSAAGKKLFAAAKEGRLRDFSPASESLVALAAQANEAAAQITAVAAFDHEAALSSASF